MNQEANREQSNFRPEQCGTISGNRPILVQRMKSYAAPAGIIHRLSEEMIELVRHARPYEDVRASPREHEERG